VTPAEDIAEIKFTAYARLASIFFARAFALKAGNRRDTQYVIIDTKKGRRNRESVTFCSKNTPTNGNNMKTKMDKTESEKTRLKMDKSIM
jgi:uncharacterized protein (DUF2252 family)